MTSTRQRLTMNLIKGIEMLIKVNDPLGDMRIDPFNIAAQTAIINKTYFFCTQECKNKFDM